MISVIIPLYNKAETITRTLSSILSQEYDNYEVVIVDDGSTDNGLEVVKSLRSDKISIYCQPNKGPSAARNLGVRKAKGDWVVFMDADDWFEQNAFTVFESMIHRKNKYDFFCFNYYIEQNKRRFLYAGNYKTGQVKNNFFSWCAGMCMPRAGAALIKKELLIKHPFNEDLHRYEDAEMLFELMRTTTIYRCSTPVMTYNCHSSEASKPCKDVAQDFIGHLVFKRKPFWEQYALFQLYKQGLDFYPEDMRKLYYITGLQRIKFKFAAIIIGRMKKYHII